MPITTARRCRHNRETCPDCGTMTKRWEKIATFEPVDENGYVSVLIDGKARRQAPFSRPGALFQYQAGVCDPATWTPQTDELAKLHGHKLGPTLTVAKDHVLAFRTGQLGWDWTVPILPTTVHTAWYTRGENTSPGDDPTR